MKKLVLVIVMTMCLIGITGQASAATTGTISATVSLEVVSVSLSESAWTIGPIGLNGTDTLPAIIATNLGDVNIDLKIKVASESGGWTVSGTTGLNQYTVQANSGTPLLSPESFLLTTTDSDLAGNVSSASGTQEFDLTFTAPSSDNIGAGIAQSFDVVITASPTP